jgi:dihydrodipicolinate synthase/N-acetylneuraminate lyase
MTKKLGGIIHAVPTPFDADGMIDEKTLRELIEYFIRSRVHGFSALATVGMGPAMSPEERKKVAEIICDQTGSRTAVMIHVGTADTPTTVQLAKHAQDIGADAIMVIAPYYYVDHSEEEILNHFRTIAKATSIPMYLYDNSRYGIHLTTPLLARFAAECSNFAGVKVAYGTPNELIQVVKALPKEAVVISGNIFGLLPGYFFGVKGAVHTAGAFYPEVLVGFWNALKSREWNSILNYYDKLNKAYAVMRQVEKGASVTVARLRGFDIKMYPRWQTKTPTQAQVDILRSKLSELGIGKISLTPMIGGDSKAPAVEPV